MPQSVRWRGVSLYRLGVFTHHNLDGLLNLDMSPTSAIIAVGEAASGEPQASVASPVVHEFSDPDDMIGYFISGNLADMARCLFDSARDGQYEGGAAIGGASVVYAIKTNQSTQAAYTLDDGAAHNCVTLSSRHWGLYGNQTYFKLEVSGTGLQLTCGRAGAPLIGEQVSSLFSITGTDEWFTCQYTGLLAAATMSFDGTTFTTDTTGTTDDISITCTGKTVAAVIQEINGSLTGTEYTASVARADRTDTLFTYVDRFALIDIKAGAKSQMGVAWDIVAWCTANSEYVEATWVAGYEPQTYTQRNLTGGTLGTTDTTARITDALKVASRMNARAIVSGYNAAVAAGSVDTVNGLFFTHLNNVNAIGGSAERQGFLCNDDTTKAAMYAAVVAYNNEWGAVTNNRIYREDATGTKVWLGAHCTAACAGGMVVGSPIATPLTRKYIKCSDMDYVATDFDPTEDTDFENAIKSGILMLEQEPGKGTRFAKGISTYNQLDNDGRILLEIVAARNWHKRTLRAAIEDPQIGHKIRGTVTLRAIQGIVLDAHRQMSDLNSDDFILIDGTDADGETIPPYRNIRLVLSGDQIYVTGEITFTCGLNWVFNDFRATMPSGMVA